MSKLIFVSTGRCGTRRLSEIFQAYLPKTQYSVVHQMKYSRLANVVGNVLYYTGESIFVRERLYHFLIDRYDTTENFISTDPLSSMIIPEALVRSAEVSIIQIIRDRDEFAHSFFRWSRNNPKSFLAHNLIPCWQPGVYPLENAFSRSIIDKYKRLSDLKNQYFEERYSDNPHYRKFAMDELFTTSALNDLVQQFFHRDISVSEADLFIRSNASAP